MNWRQVRKWSTIGMIITTMGIGLLSSGVFRANQLATIGTLFSMVGVGMVTFVKHTRRED